MAKKVKVNIDDLENHVRKKGQEACRLVAGKIRDDLTLEAKNAISEFYNSYTPDYYKRHFYNFQEKSFKKYYANPHNKIYYGGVELTPNAMDDIYQDSVEQVFQSVYEGFHGPASMIGTGYASIGETPIKFSKVPERMWPSPMELLYRKRDYIIDHIQDYIDYAQKIIDL